MNVYKSTFYFTVYILFTLKIFAVGFFQALVPCTYNDCYALQHDINMLEDWCTHNKMKFHPNKCKVLQIAYNDLSWLHILPFPKFSYTLNDNMLDYIDNECDLGITVNTTYSWNDQHDKIFLKT